MRPDHSIQIFSAGKIPDFPGFFPAVVFALQMRLLMAVKIAIHILRYAAFSVA